MGFFCVLRENDDVDFDVEKLDLNVWVLPGILGRRVMFCDVGLKLKILRIDPNAVDRRPRLQLGIPFGADDNLRDLTHLFYDERNVANLVFGNKAPAPSPQEGAYHYNDGDETEPADLILTPLDLQSSKRQQEAVDKPFSVWRLQVARSVQENSTIYLRCRFRVRKSGRTWSWTKIGQRRSFAIADLRVNEFRDRPDLNPSPDFANDAKPIGQANVLLVTSAKLKAGRVSPQPRYVRVLEGRLWESYIGRRLGKKGETFVVTFWQRNNIQADDSFRTFLEVERRRPTASRFAIISSAITISGLALLSPPGQFQNSLLWTVLSSGWTIAGGISVGVVVAFVRLGIMLFSRWPKLVAYFRRLEDRFYRIR
ncbi:hypothetical protein ACIQUM_33855 [Amycolatopsis azurea]|uniref:hypothetical protein n=1 Tax=Amycolatopsis azurea TaxID=36819 RepID=UPI00381B8615